MRHCDRLEIGVAQWDVAHPELLEVDSLSGTAVELQYNRAARAGDDRRRSAPHTPVRNADTDRRLADQGDGDHAPRQRLAVGELSSGLAAGGSSRERNAPTRDLVCPRDDLSLIARLRVDEHEEHGIAWVAIDAEEGFRGGRAPGRTRIGGSPGAHSDRD